MANNKIVFGKKVLIDLTKDTVTADTLMKGIKAHDKTGALIIGVKEEGGGSKPTTPTPGDNVVAMSYKVAKITSSTPSASGLIIDIKTKGTYRIRCVGVYANTGKAAEIILYKNGKTTGVSASVPPNDSAVFTLDIACEVNDRLEMYGKEDQGNVMYPLSIIGFSVSLLWEDAGTFAQVYAPDPGVLPEWKQPTAADPYMKGDKVRHNGKNWISTVDRNVWEPGVYGWDEI